MSLAGIWATAKTVDGKTIDTCAIITTGANAAVEPIHNRMPVIIERSDWNQWLQPETVSDDILRELLRPFDADRMQAWGVAHAVNRVTNDSPFLIQPIA